MIRKLVPICMITLLGVWGCTQSQTGQEAAPSGETPTTEVQEAQQAAPAAPAQAQKPASAAMQEAGKTGNYDFFALFNTDADFAPFKGMVGKVSQYEVKVKDTVRRGLFEHAPAKCTFRGLKIQQGSTLEFTPQIEPKELAATDGVNYIVTVTPEGGSPEVVYERELQPKAVQADQYPAAESVALGKFAGKTVDMTFAIDNKPNKNITGDWALWLDLKISVK